jgi:hypothetical protein
LTYLRDLAVDLRFYLDGRVCLDAADCVNSVGDIPLHDLGGENWHGVTLAEGIAATLRASAQQHQRESRNRRQSERALAQRTRERLGRFIQREIAFRPVDSVQERCEFKVTVNV